MFDLDGTLADSLGDISRALGRVLRRHGRKTVSEDETRVLIGKGPRTLMERAWILTGSPLNEGEARNITQEYLEEYRKSLKAILMKRSYEQTVNAQEREAYSAQEYIDLLKGLKEAVEREEEVRWGLVAAQARIEVWRSQEATNRAEGRATV